jgi:tetratricopeptide (TPR) repeat protein
LDDRLASNIATAWNLLSEERGAEALELLQRDREQLATVPEFADVWLALADEFDSDEGRLADARLVAESFPEHPSLIWAAANVLVGVAEDRPLDLPSPADGPAHEAAAMIRELLRRGDEIDEPVRAQLYVTLGAALRISSYEHDAAVEDAFQRAIAIHENDAWAWFNAGIFYKWRGRWEEGIEANRRVLSVNPRHEGALWNLAVCATGHGDTFTASEAWLALGLENRPGPDGLPSMHSIGPIKLRVSIHGAGVSANAHAAGNEAEFEHIWVSARSACHGEVVSASLNDLPADYGDVVLWDPGPVGYEKAGDLEIPMFPLLARLKEGAFHRFWFIAQQSRGGLLREIGSELPHDTALYVLDEQIQWLCAECSDGGEEIKALEAHQHEPRERHYVMGKLLMPKASPLPEAIAALYERFEETEIRLACPDLFREVGDDLNTAENETLWVELERLRALELGQFDGSLFDGETIVEPVPRGTILHALVAALGVAIVTGALAGLAFYFSGASDASAIRVMLLAQVGVFLLAAAIGAYRSRQTVCDGCGAALDEFHEHCPGCGGAVFVEPAAPPVTAARPIVVDEIPVAEIIEEERAEVVN